MVIFLFIFLLGFSGVYYAMPHSIRKLRESGQIARDMYKFEKPHIPTNAGIIILFTSFIAVALAPLLIRGINFFYTLAPGQDFYNLTEANLALLLVVSMYSVYGLVDDLVDVGRISKLFIPIVFGVPLISVVYPDYVFIPYYGYFYLHSTIFFGVNYNDIFRVIIIPVYVMVVSNLVNMHSGYNGLQSGLSIIVLSTITVKSWIEGSLIDIIPVSAFLGGMCAFWLFNRYPAKVFEGNVGSMLFGSLIGCTIVINEFWWFGFFILIPHTINFLLWFLWLYLMKKYPEEYLQSEGDFEKFGKIKKDEFIVVPNRLTLKWIPNYYFDLNERQSTNIMYFTTLVFCLFGLIFIPPV